MRHDITLKIYKRIGQLAEQIELATSLKEPKFLSNSSDKKDVIELQWLKCEILLEFSSYSKPNLEKQKTQIYKDLCDNCRNGGKCQNDFINLLKINLIDNL